MTQVTFKHISNAKTLFQGEFGRLFAFKKSKEFNAG